MIRGSQVNMSNIEIYKKTEGFEIDVKGEFEDDNYDPYKSRQVAHPLS